MTEDWMRLAAAKEEELPHAGIYPVAGLVRRARRIADVSQRQMARLAQVSPSTVGRIESGAMAPTLDVFQRLLATARLSLVVIDSSGHLILPMRDIEDTRDGANRHYPSHLDTILDPRPGEWWADGFGLARPPETFWRDRRRRDEMRARSQWEVRVKQLRYAPEPPDVIGQEAWQRFEALRPQRPRPPAINPADIDVDEWSGDPSTDPPPCRGR